MTNTQIIKLSRSEIEAMRHPTCSHPGCHKGNRVVMVFMPDSQRWYTFDAVCVCQNGPDNQRIEQIINGRFMHQYPGHSCEVLDFNIKKFNALNSRSRKQHT